MYIVHLYDCRHVGTLYIVPQHHYKPKTIILSYTYIAHHIIADRNYHLVVYNVAVMNHIFGRIVLAVTYPVQDSYKFKEGLFSAPLLGLGENFFYISLLLPLYICH